MGLQLLLYNQYMMYTVMQHRICHLLEIQYDAYDVTSQATAVGSKPPAIALRACNSHTMAFGGP